MNYNVRIGINAKEVINKLGMTELEELAKELAYQHFDINDFLEVARLSYTDIDILNEMDIDDIVNYVKKAGYKVNE